MKVVERITQRQLGSFRWFAHVVAKRQFLFDLELDRLQTAAWGAGEGGAGVRRAEKDEEEDSGEGRPGGRWRHGDALAGGLSACRGSARWRWRRYGGSWAFCLRRARGVAVEAGDGHTACGWQPADR